MFMATDDLINTGILALRSRTVHEQRTAVVLGSSRGGTSMAAGVLYHLGVYMGDRLGVTYEDRAFSLSVENADIDRLRSLRDERDHTYPVWGWKRPSAYKYLDFLERELTNPYYIMVFRDVFAIANRRRISMPGQFDFSQSMRSALKVYTRMIDLLDMSDQPCLLLSYDKCLQQPAETVRAIADFLGLDAVEPSEAIRFIRHNPDDYLQRSRRPTPEPSATPSDGRSIPNDPGRNAGLGGSHQGLGGRPARRQVRELPAPVPVTPATAVWRSISRYLPRPVAEAIRKPAKRTLRALGLIRGV